MTQYMTINWGMEAERKASLVFHTRHVSVSELITSILPVLSGVVIAGHGKVRMVSEEVTAIATTPKLWEAMLVLTLSLLHVVLRAKALGSIRELWSGLGCVSPTRSWTQAVHRQSAAAIHYDIGHQWRGSGSEVVNKALNIYSNNIQERTHHYPQFFKRASVAHYLCR